MNNLPVLEKSQELLKVSGEEIGARGSVDVRVWRTDVEEGMGLTATNKFSTAGGREDLRTFTATLTKRQLFTFPHYSERGSGGVGEDCSEEESQESMRGRRVRGGMFVHLGR
ncbi:MAG: hypothetical protein Q4E25_05335 [Corynebacterium sp.]|nr:hypothetical protein [Corynebacterium sp.]MDO5032052.1 hypothetical protein [Corynebacterium sp.]